MAQNFRDATAWAKAIRDGEISPLELLELTIKRAEAVQPDLNFLTHEMFDKAREKARGPLGDGPFAGVPYLIKDMHAVAGEVTSYCTNATIGAPAAEKNSVPIQSLEDAGLNFFGLTTLGEFGYLPTTESMRFGATRSPWNTGHSPGGSSGGSAAAVAAGVLPMADAADGGGSIRIPASHCGLFGLKPSRGRNKGEFGSNTGVDLVGLNPVSRTVRDTAGVMAATERTGGDKVFEPMGLVDQPLDRPLKIGLQMPSLHGHSPDEDVSHVLDKTALLLEEMGHHVEVTQWPFDTEMFTRAFGAVWVIGCGLVNQGIADAIGRDDLTGILEPYTIAMGNAAKGALPGTLQQAQQAIKLISRKYFTWFDDYDVILSPVLLTPPPEIGHITGMLEPQLVGERVEHHAGYTMLQNATGGPAMSVPMGLCSKGLPIGMQFAANLGEDALLLQLALSLEEARPWAQVIPPLWAPDIAG